MINNVKILKNLKIFAADFLPMTASEFEMSAGFRRRRLLIFRPEQYRTFLLNIDVYLILKQKYIEFTSINHEKTLNRIFRSRIVRIGLVRLAKSHCFWNSLVTHICIQTDKHVIGLPHKNKKGRRKNKTHKT